MNISSEFDLINFAHYYDTIEITVLGNIKFLLLFELSPPQHSVRFQSQLSGFGWMLLLLPVFLLHKEFFWQETIKSGLIFVIR